MNSFSLLTASVAGRRASLSLGRWRRVLLAVAVVVWLAGGRPAAQTAPPVVEFPVGANVRTGPVYVGPIE